jgi:STE24 endopeptidase
MTRSSSLRFAGLALVLTWGAYSPLAPARAGSLPQAPQASAQAPSQIAAAPDASASAGSQASEKRITAYTLPPDLYRKAHNLGKIAFWGQIITFVYSVIILILILKWKWAPKFRDWAERRTSVRFLQAAIFTPLFLFAYGVLSLPPDILRHWILRLYGLSIQGWGSWLWDWTKSELITFVLGTILVWALYAVMRKSSRGWWFYFWAVSLAMGIFLFFLTPVVIDPLFNKFEPLQQKDPALTASLEKMVQHAGEDIPAERMFWMAASAKVTELNAYVTGIGASKRVVVWDTTIAKMSTPQIVFVAGHEMGHYVLNHTWKGVAFFGALLFVFFYIVFRSIGWVLARWGAEWGIRGIEDWASLPALLLMLTVLFFVTSPIGSAFSRHIEHQADTYGLEVTHGLTPDSSQIAAQSFQILGEVDLADPDPNPVDIFLFYDHPAIPDRVRYSLTYDPWSKGEQPEFVK